jgi:hypothetical protein
VDARGAARERTFRDHTAHKMARHACSSRCTARVLSVLPQYPLHSIKQEFTVNARTPAVLDLPTLPRGADVALGHCLAVSKPY